MNLDSSFDIVGWGIRICVMLIGATLGIVLYVLNRKHAKSYAKWLAIIQIASSVIIPILVGSILRWRRGTTASGYSDWEQLAYEMSTIKHGAYISLVFIGLYAYLVATTTLTVREIIEIKTMSKK